VTGVLTDLSGFYVQSLADKLVWLLIMEMIYYTVAAVLLYLVSDWILNRIEIRRGERLENRSLIFFAIILVLAVVFFNLIQQLQPAAEPAASTADGQTEQGAGDTLQ
jgi:NADH:ubiquinone oxidoreductase subunit 6 (subunit J)